VFCYCMTLVKIFFAVLQVMSSELISAEL